MEERVSIYVDGGNFYHLVLKKLRIIELEFSFDAFAKFLANGRSVQKKKFYSGTVRERVGDIRSREAMIRQTKFFTALAAGSWEVETSKLRRRTEEIFIDDRVHNYEYLRKLGITSIRYERDREKGIDVKIAVDLVMGAFSKEYDTAIVVSSDADLIPAIDCVRGHFGRRIEYVGFSIPDRVTPENSTRPLPSLIQKSDLQRSLIPSDLKPFVVPSLLP